MTDLARGLLAAAVLLAPACSSDGTPFSPTLETVASSYQATTLTATESGITTDLLLLGQPGDTFIRDVPFTAERNRLGAEEASAGSQSEWF